MPRYTTSQTFTDGNTQIVALPDIVEQKREDPKGDVEEEPYEVKLQRISECVPLRITSTSGSSAGSGSGDFHQYRAMRRHEQDRLMRMEADYNKRMEERRFQQRREERLKEAEERTAKKRAKRQKKKEKRKKQKTEGAGDGSLPSVAEGQKEGLVSSDEDVEEAAAAPSAQAALD
ncbi:hypothetical protein CLOM_g4849 [Closterium sp. NIES-68]|nr:hypothetical protein CLOM_g4849 [Closterium sp. NIES-68]GJP80678.1 hypothetical protein CLOP_g10881 [Closterium sp. NIES-67]